MRFFPSRGPAGSLYITSDGTPYMRTRLGTVRIHEKPYVWRAAFRLQQAFIRAHSLRRLIHALAFVVGMLVGVKVL